MLGVAALLGVLLVITGHDAVDVVIGVAGIALLVVAWFSLGMPRLDDLRGAPVFVSVVAVAVTLMVSASPTLAIVQGIAYPIAWVFCSSIRRAVVQNIVIAAGVTIGFLVRLGTTPDALLQTTFTMVISLGFSLAMGFWIAHMSELGDRETLRIIEENARATLAETRALVASSAALGDESTDLASALHRLAERFSRETGVEVTCDVAAELALDRNAEVVVLRCVQEALGDARKHARASRIAIAVTAPEGDTHRVRVEITDDGIGFEPGSARDGFGLSGMTDRLALVHGTLDVRSAAGAGTTLVAGLPAAGVTT